MLTCSPSSRIRGAYRRIICCLAVTSLAVITAQCAAAQPPAAAPDSDKPTSDGAAMPGKITRVTLYRDRALISRQIDIAADFDGDVLMVSNLPEQLVPDSVNAESSGDVEVRSVEIITRETAVSEREEVRVLEEEIAALESEQRKLKAELESLTANLQALEQLVSFSAQKTSDDLNRGTLDATALMELEKYLAGRREEVRSRQLEIEEQSRELEELGRQKQNELNALVRGDYRQQTQARVFLDREPGEVGQLTLNYLVAGCRWVPRYAVRGAIGSDQFSIQYSALVSQISGEDWEDVQLTLSTGSPSVSAAGPELTALLVQTQTGTVFGETPSFDAEKLSERFQSLRSQLQQAEVDLGNQRSKAQSQSRDMRLNTIANQIQQLELAAEAKAASDLLSGNGREVVSQTYEIAQPVSLQSLRQQQLVRIANLELSGQLYHVATPLLSSYAYREGEMTNTESIGLLGGPADVYLDDRFVGATEIPTTASGQRLVIGFGADEQVRTRRELRSKQDTIRGGNRILQLEYRLVIANFKEEPVTVRLLDRIPTANESRDVAVKLTSPDPPLSDDVLYRRVREPRGILRWDLEVPGDSHTDKAFDVEYSYQLEFDRSRTLLTEEEEQEEVIDAFGAPMEVQGMGGMGGGVSPGGGGGSGN